MWICKGASAGLNCHTMRRAASLTYLDAKPYLTPCDTYTGPNTLKLSSVKKNDFSKKRRSENEIWIRSHSSSSDPTKCCTSDTLTVNVEMHSLCICAWVCVCLCLCLSVCVCECECVYAIECHLHLKKKSFSVCYFTSSSQFEVISWVWYDWPCSSLSFRIHLMTDCWRW